MRRCTSILGCVTLGLATLATTHALAAAPTSDSNGVLGLKPGLWETELTYQSVDGRQVLNSQDLFAQLLASVDATDLALDRVNTALAQSPCANEGAGEANSADAGGVGASGSLSQLDRGNTQRTQDMPTCTLPYAMRMKAEASINESGANTGASSSYRTCITAALAQRDAPILDAQDSCHPDQVQHDGKRETFTFSCGRGGTILQGKGESQRTFLGHILTLTDFTATTSSKTHYQIHDRMEMKYLGAECAAIKPPSR